MTELEKYIELLRKLKAESPATIICLPPHTRGLPVGSYNLELLLEMIVLNLEGNRPACRKEKMNNGLVDY